MTELNEFSEKIYVARSQLRTALWLFIEDMDPISVHSLACAGCEILAEITVATNTLSLSLIVNENTPLDDPNLIIKKVRNANWNAFKHARGRNTSIRDDNHRIKEFTDSENDALLYQGWLDLACLEVPIPVEAQVYQYWYAANYPKSVPPEERQTAKYFFTFRELASRSERKAALAQCCAELRAYGILNSSNKTDPLPLTAPLRVR